MTDYIYSGLHTHSSRSFLDGYSSLEEIAERAKSLGQKSVALTDHGEVGGHYEFQKQCLAHDVKPVFGMEGYLIDNVTRAREEKDKLNSHVTLLAKNEKGLRNLWAWSSEAYEDKFYYKPLMDWEGAKKYSEELYASDGCLLASMARAIISEDTDQQHQLMGKYLDTFGDNFFMEMHTFQFLDPSDDKQRRLNNEMTMVNQGKANLAQKYGVPLVVVNDAHYTRPEDWVNHDLVWAMNTRGNLDQTGRGQTASWMMDNEDILFYMSKHGISRSITEEAIKNTSIISDNCNVEIKSELRMPRVTPSNKDDLRLFLKSLEEGFDKKVTQRGLDEDFYFKRLENEIRTITDKNFQGYFNVVADYHKWAKNEANMMTGAGRGSAGGSLVAYLMDITEVDPLKYDLDFDRFLVKERKSLPDIDLDYPQSRREEVKQYLATKYGEDHICGIGTLSTLQPKGVLADLSRAMDIPKEDSRAISKVIEEVGDLNIEEGVSWTDIVQESKGELSSWARKYPELFEKMGEMVGLVRQSGTHAAGTLVSSEPLSGNLPTRVKGEHKVSAFTGDEVEELGYVKFDILGIRHLDTLQNARDMIQERHGIDLDYYSFGDKEFKDSEIWKMFETAQVNGIFQAETASMSRVGSQLLPKSEEDLSVLFAINRPGVIQAGLLEPFLKRWNGEEEVTYDHPMMEEIVGSTMGILVFQEQILATVKKLAGFTGGEADQVRKILGKRLHEQMLEKKKEFFDRALKNEDFVAQSKSGSPVDDLDKIWGSIEASGKYSFNKCVAGDTEVRLSDSGAHSNGLMTIEDMWSRIHNLEAPGEAVVGDPCRHGCNKPAVLKGRGQCKSCLAWRNKFKYGPGLHAMSLDEDGRIRKNRIKDVHKSGVKKVWRVSLEDGKHIDTTLDHRHMTPLGWRQVADLKAGDELLVCGDYEKHEYKTGMWNTTSAEPTYDSAKLPTRERNGENSLGFRDGGFLALKEWTEGQDWVCRHPGCGRSKSSGDRIERAHLDGDRTNNSPENLMMLCASHHKEHDYRANNRVARGEKGYPAIPVKITSVECVGEVETYDLEMEAPNHSWVGNGIVTHNSHSVSYALLGAWEVWTKHYFFPEFITALLQTDPDKISKHVAEARRNGIEILPPDINESGKTFTLTSDTTIRYGLGAIAHVGLKAVQEILRNRPYSSLEDFVDKNPARIVNKRVVVNLIRIGAFDSMGDRSEILQKYYDIRKIKESAPDFTLDDVVYEAEMELVGTYIIKDPMDRYRKAIENVCASSPHEIEELQKGETGEIGGQVTKIKEHTTKGGRQMAFTEITWDDEVFEVTVFPDAWSEFKNFMSVGAPVATRVSRLDRGCHMVHLERLDWIFN